MWLYSVATAKLYLMFIAYKNVYNRISPKVERIELEYFRPFISFSNDLYGSYLKLNERK